jgi:gas vesicle protein
MSTEPDRTVTFLAGVALGAALGAGAALLFAPDSGHSTRRKIARGSRRLGQRGRNAWDDLRHELKREFRRALRKREEQRIEAAHRKSLSRRAASSL